MRGHEQLRGSAGRKRPERPRTSCPPQPAATGSTVDRSRSPERWPRLPSGPPPPPPGRGLVSSSRGSAPQQQRWQKTTLGWRQSAEKAEHLRRSLRTASCPRLVRADTPSGRPARRTTGLRTRHSGILRSDWAPAFPPSLPPLSPPPLLIGPATASPARADGRTPDSVTWVSARSAPSTFHWLEDLLRKEHEERAGPRTIPAPPLWILIFAEADAAEGTSSL